ncbi:MAG TPA: hypothetical protein VL096_08760 [Pirellulaceae bacterium]|nr:hypothetical protein [Pirellulaceae bacterium]
MKRNVVKITGGVLFVLAWAGAGVYAFWGGSKQPETETPPAVSATDMSAAIAAVNAEKAAGEDASEAPPAQPPAADGLFNTSKMTSSGFKPRAGSFQPPALPPASPPDTGYSYGEAAPVEVTTPETAAPTYGADVAVEDAAPAPEADPNTALTGTDEQSPASAYGAGANPLRRPSTFQPPAELPGEATAPEQGELAPPPSRFGAVDPEPSPARRPSAYGVTADVAPTPIAEATPEPIAETNIDPRADAGAYGFPASGRGAGLQNAAPVAAAVAGGAISARPGEKELEGAQSPSLVIEKIAPPEIQVGKAATFEIHVRNVGQTAAKQVVVTDHIPAGTRLVDAKPEPQAGPDGALAWQLGTMEPGAEKAIVLQLMPEKEGEIGSVAQVAFAATASAKTICTKPLLAVEHVAPAKVMIGEVVVLQITISNPGTGVATGIVLQEDVPVGLTHSAGKELEYEVGTLQPGESRKLELTLEAAKAGQVLNTIHVRGEANLHATHSVHLEVIAPQLEVAMNGPKVRYLDRQATYTVSIANPGTASARDVEIVAYLPKGMKFVSTDHEGQYDPQHHAVYWSLEELPAAQKGTASVVTMPFEPGEQKLRVEGQAQQGLKTSDEETVQVEAIAQLAFEIIDEADPIEVGAETIYQVRVTNVGSKVATNIQVAAGLPPELRPVAGDGATRGTVQGPNVIFEPLAKLAPQAEAIFKIQATGLRTGDYTIRVQVTSDELQTPVTKEEHTRVYADR